MAVEAEDTDTGDAGGAEGKGAADDQRIANMVNAAVSGHLKRALPKALADAMETHLAPFKERLGSGTKAEPAPKGGDETSSKIADLERKYQESERARAAERVAGYQHRAFDTVRGELSGKVRADALDSALKILKADGCIQVREDGTPFLAMNDQELSITEGVKLFLKTKEGALFLPAPAPAKPGQKGGGKFTPRAAAPEAKETPMQKTLRMIEERKAARG